MGQREGRLALGARAGEAGLNEYLDMLHRRGPVRGGLVVSVHGREATVRIAWVQKLIDWIRGKKPVAPPAPVPPEPADVDPGTVAPPAPAPTPAPEPPLPVVEPPSPVPAPSEPEPLPPSVPVYIDYAGDWGLTLHGRFHGAGRIIRNGDDAPSMKSGLDLFWWHGDRLNLRLFIDRIFFTACRVGDGYAIVRPNDHWASTAVSCKELRTKTPSMLTIEYRYSQRLVRMFVNGRGVLEFFFRVDSMPSPRRKLWLIGFEGTVTVQSMKGT